MHCLIVHNLLMEKQVKTALLVGFGCIGQALTPLLRQLKPFADARISAIAASDDGAAIAAAYGVNLSVLPLSPGNLEHELASRLRCGDLLINVSVNVASAAMIRWCGENGVLYLDTCVEPWEGGYANHSERSNMTQADVVGQLQENRSPVGGSSVYYPSSSGDEYGRQRASSSEDSGFSWGSSSRSSSSDDSFGSSSSFGGGSSDSFSSSDSF